MNSKNLKNRHRAKKKNSLRLTFAKVTSLEGLLVDERRTPGPQPPKIHVRCGTGRPMVNDLEVLAVADELAARHSQCR